MISFLSRRRGTVWSRSLPRTHGVWAPGLGLVLLAVAAVCFPVTLVGATFPLTWRWSNPTPHGNNIIDMAYGAGMAVQVAERGQIYTSDDMILWTPRTSHVTNSLRAVTFFGQRVVISGENGLVLYADSPTAFQTVGLGTTDWLEGVAASTNLLVAVGDNAAIYTSSDAVIWQRHPQSFSTWLRGVAYGAGLFVAVGETGFIATSTNGVQWHQVASGTTVDLNKVEWVTDGFWAVGDSGATLNSVTGATWRSVTTGATNTLFTVAGNGAERLVVGDDELRLRGANLAWTDQISSSLAAPAPLWTYYDAFFNAGSYFLGGRTGMLVASSTSTNGVIAWSPYSDSIRNWLWDLTVTPNFYAAVGDRATVMTSDNGLDWTLELVPNAVTNAVFLGVNSTTNLLVAVGNQGAIITSANVYSNVTVTNIVGTNVIVTNMVASAFGVIWNAVQPRPTTNDLQGITPFGNQWVATGDNGLVLTSPDGATWTRRTTPTTSFLSSVTTFPGGLVAVGDRGTILTSANGVSWTAQTSGTTNWVYRVRYLGGRLMAVGQNGILLTSGDGARWSALNSGVTNWLNDVAFVDNAWFVAGTQGTLQSSTNGTAWTDAGMVTEKSLYALGAISNQLITVGIEGIILRAQLEPILDPVTIQQFARHQSATNAFENVFLFSGKPDERFTLDASPDLKSWTTGPLLEFFDSSGTLLYLETVTNAAPDLNQYFRGASSP